MKSLSLKQAQSCENATTPKSKCTCRCGGAHHGSARVIVDQGRIGFEELPHDDPHHLPLNERSMVERQQELPR